MLFGSKLDNEIYTPWKEHYMNYTALKKLLKEGVILKNNWTDKDEQNFVAALDKDLDKVYTFQVNKYDELNETLENLQAQTESPKSSFDDKKFTEKLEETLNLAQELEHFQRLNYTGFTKIVKKHDRIHPEYSVKPLLNVRLKNLPYHSEDYSPLLYKISALFQFLRDNYSVDQSISKLSSYHEDSSEFESFKFWVHKDNLMEVKTNILRHLPVLVFNSQRPQTLDDMMDGADSDDENEDDNPTVNCLYFDSPSFELYNDKLVKKPDSSSLRIKWIGKLADKPKITVEKKVFDQTSQDFSLGQKITIKEKYLDSFVAGNFDSSKFIKKMIKRNAKKEEIQQFEKDINDLQKFIQEHNLQPCMRTTYKRTAFQIPGDDRIRIVIDSDLMFIREDSFDSDRPIRDPSKWHRTDIDQNISKPNSFLRKGEFFKFPYSVMEIKVKKSQRNRRPQWIGDLVSSHLVKEIPNFSKFIQGIASLFLEDDKLSNIPFWFHDLEGDIKIDPQSAYTDSQNKAVKQQSEEENLKKFKSMLTNSTTTGGTNTFNPRSKSFSGSLLLDPPSPLTKDKQIGIADIPEVLDEENQSSGDDDDYYYEEEDNVGSSSILNKVAQGSAAIAKLVDVDSEDEEIILPKGVVKPDQYIKNMGPLKIEPKVWMANERTFNRWLHVTTLLSSLTFIVYSSAKKSNSTQLAELLAYFYFALTIFSGIWGYYTFNRRRDIIIERSSRHLDNVIGPLIVALGLMLALTINFVFGFKHLHQSNEINVSIAGINQNFYDNHPVQRFLHEIVFKIIGV